MNYSKHSTTDVVILGAGLTGLTAAHYLHKMGANFVVLETQNRVGGVIRSIKEGDFLLENGPNTGVVGNTTVVELFEDLSQLCELELASNQVNKRYILKNSKWEHLPLGLSDAIKTPLFTFKDKLRVLAEPFRPAGRDPHENLASFVKRRLGVSFLNYAIDPFIIGVYAGDPNYLIPKYALPKLYDLEQKYGSLIGGAIKKGFEKKTPQEQKVNKKVFSFSGGLGALTNALHQSAGIENFNLGIENPVVSKFDAGFIVSYYDMDGESRTIHAKKVISTLGAFVLEYTFPFIDTAAIQKINSLHYTKVIEISIGWKQWEGRKLDGFGGLIPSLENRDILGVLFMSSLFTNRAPKEGALLSIFMGGVRRQDLIQLSDDEIKSIVEKECMELLELDKFQPDIFKITRHNYAIPQYGIESGERFATINELEKLYPGLQIGGNLRNGIGMADRIKQGKEMAEVAVHLS